jgi:O-succinylbenzoic acid--CoA ligase
MWLHYNGEQRSVEEWYEADVPATSNLYKTIQFYKAWHSGQDEFELFTSGSTGTPKKITLTRAQLKASAHKTITAVGLQQNYTALVALDVQYIAGRMMLVRSMEANMNIVLTEPSSNPFATISDNIVIDFTALVPYQVHAILQSDQRERFNQLHAILIGGAALDYKAKHALQAYRSTVFETYGMTETLSHIALRNINGNDATEYFKVLPGITIATDARGCLCITADYLGDTVITNDIVDILTPNTFNWLGRADFVINSGGVKVFPESIERKLEVVLDEMKIERRYFVAGLPDERLGNAVTLVIEGLPLPEEALHGLQQALRNKLDKYEVPRAIRFAKQFATTDSGKINRLATSQQLQ